MKLVEIYFMNLLLRYICINSTVIQSNSTLRNNNFTFRDENNKMVLLMKTKEIKLKAFLTMKIKVVEIR